MTYERFVEVYNDTTNYPTLAAVGQELGIKVQTVKNKAVMLRRLRRQGREDVPEVIYRGGPNADDGKLDASKRDFARLSDPTEPLDILIDRAIRHSDRVAAHDAERAIIDVTINSPGPFLVAGLPDQHLNNPGANLRKAFDDAQAIAEEPDAYAISIGDTIDNFIIGRLERARRKDVMTHEDSWRLMEHYIDILAPSLVAIIGGNHLDWAEMCGGVDVFKQMLKEHGLTDLYDQDEVRVRLNTPSGRSFVHLARHIFPGHSRFNAAHGVLSWMLERWSGEEVFWGGHTHVAGHVTIEREWLGKHRPIHGVQLPAYKEVDRFAKKKGFRRNMPFQVPAVVHDPARDKTIFFDDLHDGLEHLRVLRGR